MLLGFIIGCEIGFWAVLLVGLSARYLWRRRRLSNVLLTCVPLFDVVLLVLTIVDLRRGVTANWTHGLAACYVGFSVAFGPSTIRSADAWFAYRYAGGPRPPKRPRYGRERTLREWGEFRKGLLAWAITCALLLLAIAMVGDADRTRALNGWLLRLTLFIGAWALWALRFRFWPVRERRDG